MKHPVNQLHRYVRVLFGVWIEGPFWILGLWGTAVYILYFLTQFLRWNRRTTYLIMGI